ncbi:MAG TPA: NADH-quinone oxidoreductase subunit C [bacterium]|nr:NADH-quinone oxidoreductase subunit C [bacterium]
MPRKAISPAARDRIVQLIETDFPGALQQWYEAHGELTLVVDPERIRSLCVFLRDHPDLQFDFLSDLTAVDLLGQEPRFVVVYNLFSTIKHHRVRLRAAALGDPPSIDTVCDIWLSANWHERECWDLFGVVFLNHPDLRRIMLPQNWVGHPLRRDYETAEEECYDYLGKRLADE